MERRTFILNSAILLGGSVLLGLNQKAIALSNIEQEIQHLESKHHQNRCHSVNEGGFQNALEQIKSTGLVSTSIGCKSPHKHILFIDERYLIDPTLIEKEADQTLADGTLAKTFLTSDSFDMGFWVKKTVGVHKHSVAMTQMDIIQITQQNLEIKKIAYQFVWPLNKNMEPGHVFHLSLGNRI
jgi:hypothetical protein